MLSLGNHFLRISTLNIKLLLLLSRLPVFCHFQLFLCLDQVTMASKTPETNNLNKLVQRTNHFYFTLLPIQVYMKLARFQGCPGCIVKQLQTGWIVAVLILDGIHLVQQCQRPMWNMFWKTFILLKKCKVCSYISCRRQSDFISIYALHHKIRLDFGLRSDSENKAIDR